MRESFETHRSGWYGHVTTAQGVKKKKDDIVLHFLAKDGYFSVCNGFTWQSGRTARMDRKDLKPLRYCLRCLNKVG
jgi:hypothetical protein